MSDDFLVGLGKRIKVARKMAGYTLAEAGAEAEISRQTLSLIEHGRVDTSIGNVYQLAKTYRVAIGTLIPDGDVGSTLEVFAEHLATVRLARVERLLKECMELLKK